MKKALFIMFMSVLLPMMAAAQVIRPSQYDYASVGHPSAESFSFDEVNYSPSKTVFKLFAPHNSLHIRKVRLKIYDHPTSTVPIRTVKMKRVGYRNFPSDNLWKAEIKGDLKGMYYTFQVSVDSTLIFGNVKCYTGMVMLLPAMPIVFSLDKNKGKRLEETPGVFAKAVGVNGKRGFVADLQETDPEGWANDVRPKLPSPADMVIYEMHHRDFSIDESSGIVNKGKYLALTEPKAINHLKELGVTAVHILPSYDFGSVDETRLGQPQYNWGYDPVNYNVPDGSYSTNPYDPLCRIREFKQMVQALHRNGIRVILDVVYNHTYNLNSNFQNTFPDYYYRRTSDGKYSNGSGCGNETASERPMMRRFIIESVKHWINEYHIDGFRFDLMGVHDIETMNAIRAEVDKIDPTIFIYGEGWSAGSCAYPQEKLAVKAHVRQLNGIAAFSDDMRDALRGPFSDDTKGAFLAGLPGEEESIKFGLVGAIEHPDVDMSRVNYSKEPWTNEPTQQISYVSYHDDMCLVDRLKTEMPGIQTDELIRLDLLAQTFVFTSQGVPFMLSGEEMLRDKKGVHNSFESPDSVNRLDWNNLERYPQVFQYYKNIIALRKNHPALRLGNANLVRSNMEFLPTEPCVVGFRLKNHAGGDAWNNIIVLFNSNRKPVSIAIPEGKYTIVCRDGKINESGLGSVEGDHVVIPRQSAMILHD